MFAGVPTPGLVALKMGLEDMLADAIRDIEVSLRRDDRERRRQAADRALLRQAERYAHQLEELLLKGQRRVPVELATEIRHFVQQRCPQTIQCLSDRVWAYTQPLLDLLFDVQERLQLQSPALVAASAAIVEAA